MSKLSRNILKVSHNLKKHFNNYFSTLFPPVHLEIKSQKWEAMSAYLGSKRLQFGDIDSDRTNSALITDWRQGFSFSFFFCWGKGEGWLHE